MFNRIALTIALLTVGVGVDSSWAGPDQPSGLRSTQISSYVANPSVANPPVSHGFSVPNFTPTPALRQLACQFDEDCGDTNCNYCYLNQCQRYKTC
jgi:hypothetical protein